MRRPGARLTIQQMMLATAVVAAAFGAAHAGGAPGTGLAIVLSCVVGLSSVRFSRALTLRRENGLTTSPAQKVLILAVSTVAAAVVIGLSDLAFIGVLQAYRRSAHELMADCHWSPCDDPVVVSPGVAFGTLLAVRVARCLSEALDGGRRDGRRAFRECLASWWPLASSVMIGVLLLASYARS